ncbi:hypothetical protein JIQ42_07770 [Leishmania sp. Namibia]|uniref:hypothetical protein n=1 Tax=Leishmania sp. Namibia TaxID=2802991 RepID=UPI001B702D8A|nr:hypothetical protein JIQ42_07770 [Leishmania sp. Namibia]
MTLSSVTKAAADTSSGGATATDSATPTRYRWQPARPLRDLVKEFVMHLHHYRLTDRAPEATVGVRAAVSAAAGASNRDSSVSELQRVLETFTQYAHEAAPVEFSLAVFDPILGAYVPYVYPLRAAAAQAARAGNAGEAASPWGASDLCVIRGFVGCVLHPCSLDMVLQAGRHRCGTDIHVVTHGHAAETEERMFICSILNDIADEAVSASRELQAAITEEPVNAAAVTASEGSGLTAGSGGCVATASSDAASACTPVEASASMVAASLSAAKQSTGRVRRGSEAYNDADAAELLARRCLAGSTQLRKGRRAEQRYRVRLHACEPLLSLGHFFAVSWKDGLAAARALLVDASALLQYYYDVLDALSAASSPAGLPSPFSSSSRSSSRRLSGLRMRATVPALLRRGAPFEVRGQRSRQRVPYVFFGEEPSALMAAAAARAQAMGAFRGDEGEGEGAVNATSAPSVVSSLKMSTAVAATATPPIELLAAAMMFVAPSAAARATTLATRIPLALERILLKALPKLYLAIIVLTLGVCKDEVLPVSLLEHVYGAWWRRAAATPVQGVSSAATASATPALEAAAAAVATATAAPITSSAAPTPSVATTGRREGTAGPAGGGNAEDEESVKLLYRRYVYLGECFSSLAYLCAELPGMRLMEREACTMALLYLPRNASLWALSGTLADRIGSPVEALDNMRVAVALASLEESAESSLAAKSRCGRPSPPAAASSLAADSPNVFKGITTEEPHSSRADLLRYACAFLSR